MSGRPKRADWKSVAIKTDEKVKDVQWAVSVLVTPEPQTGPYWSSWQDIVRETLSGSKKEAKGVISIDVGSRCWIRIRKSEEMIQILVV